MKVLLDTNALMMPEQFGVDIFSELERLGYFDYLVPTAVVEELRAISKLADKGKDRRAASVALGLLTRCRILDADGEADDVLERLASETGAAVLTGDKELRKRLSKRGITVIYLRQSQYLEIDAQGRF